MSTIMNKESWNPILNYIIELKEEAKKILNDKLYDYDVSQMNCIEYWISVIRDNCENKIASEKVSEYLGKLKGLHITEYNDFILVKYANYHELFSDEDFDYNEFWDLYDGFYLEARSSVFNFKTDEVVIAAFRKFRNLNEGDENKIDKIKERIEKAKCVEITDKLDGSMQTARYYNGEIVMAGSQALSTKDSWRLADGRRMLEEGAGYIQMLKDNPDTTFIFEYISIADAHIVLYTEEQEGLYLIGMRDVRTGKEASYAEVVKMADAYGVKRTKIFEKSFEEVNKELDDKLSSEAEGFVINIDGYKVKLKYNDYVNMHGLYGKYSSINVIINSIIDNTFDDIMGKIPASFQAKCIRIAGHVYSYKNKVEQEIEEYYNKSPHDADIKTFMIWVENNVPSHIKGFIREKYKGNSYNVLRPGKGRRLKLKDMGVEDYKILF